VLSWRDMRRWLLRGWQVLGLGLFVYVLRRQPLGSIGDAVIAMGPIMLAAPALGLVWLATRTSALARLLDGKIPWRELFVARLVGDGYNAVVPMAGVAGEPFKLERLRQYIGLDDALTGLVRDRLIDNALGLLYSAGCIAVALPAFVLPAPGPHALATYSIVAMVVGLVLLAVMVTRLPGRLGAMVGRWFGATTRDPAPLPLPVARDVVGWFLATRLLQTCETALLLHAIGVDGALRTVLLVDGALNAAGFLGFMLPQGLGVVEGTAVFLLTALGAAPAAATAFALTRRGRVFAVSLLGIATHVAGLGSVRRGPFRVLDRS
jgi:uncharacterized membrane protein YbhN (UPF0104 family)